MYESAIRQMFSSIFWAEGHLDLSLHLKLSVVADT